MRTCIICAWFSFPCLHSSPSWGMFARRSSAILSPERGPPVCDLNAAPSAEMMFVVAVFMAAWLVGGGCGGFGWAMVVSEDEGRGREEGEEEEEGMWRRVSE